MDDRRSPLRLLSVQATTSVTSEVSVYHTLLTGLQPIMREKGIAVEILHIQGIDATSGKDAGSRAASLFRQVPNVMVEQMNVGKLGQPDSSYFDRAMKFRDLACLQLARRRLLARARSFQPDVVYSAQQLWDLRIATPLARSLVCSQIVHLHYNVGPSLGPGVVDTLRQAPMVIGVSEFIRDDAIAHGVEPSRVHAVYNTAPIPRALTAHERRATRQDVRAELGLPEDALLVGMVGRLSPSKGQQHLMAAMIPLLQNDPRIHLVLAGSEYPARNGISDGIKQIARKHNVASQVHLLGFRSDVPRILDALDLFAHPTRQEPCGLALLEAAAHGLPVVAWREGGPATIVRDHETGFLVEPLDIDGLTDALRTLITDQGLRDSMGTKGRERAAKVYSPGIAAASFLSLLETAKRERHLTCRGGRKAAGLNY